MIADVIRRSPVLPRATAGAATPALAGPSRRTGGHATETVRRSTAETTAVSAVPSVTADDLVRRLSGDTSGGSGAMIRRATDGPSARSRGVGRMPTAPPAARQRRSTPTGGDAVSATTPAIAGTIRRSVAGTTRSATAATTAAAATDTIRRRLSAEPSGGTTATTTNGSVSEQTNGDGDSVDRRTRAWPMMTKGIDSSTLRDLTDWIVEQVEERVIRELERRGGRYRGEF
jgi:hypothetical protein